jgi:HSP20 family protein
MLESLKQTGKHLGYEIGRGWELFAQGWRELYRRSGSALTYFEHNKFQHPGEDLPPLALPSWGLLAGEVEETDKEFVVRLEVPGVEKEDCRVTIENDVLHLDGDRHMTRTQDNSTFHLTERAYGAFHRSVPLPGNVLKDQATASYQSGVLTVRVPKLAGTGPTRVAVH